MRLAVIADVHDNLPALEVVAEDAEEEGVDAIIAAGDLLHRGPSPQETIHFLKSIGALMIRGNTDDYVLDYAAGRAPSVRYTNDQWAPLRWTSEHVDHETLDFVASLPEQRIINLDGATPIRVFHAAPYDPVGRLIPDGDPEALQWFHRAGFLADGEEPPALDSCLSGIPEPVVISAHTHIPWSQWDGDRLALNPGAVSGTLNEDPRAQYALLTWQDYGWTVEHRAVAYDLERLRKAYRDSGFLEAGGALARAFLQTVETGRNVVGPFFRHIDELMDTRDYATSGLIPEAVWDEAVDTFPWVDS